MAELHGDEAVAKVNDEKSISQSSLGSGSMMNDSSNKIAEMFNNLFEKMDSLIDLSDTSMENQKKFLEIIFLKKITIILKKYLKKIKSLKMKKNLMLWYAKLRMWHI